MVAKFVFCALCAASVFHMHPTAACLIDFVNLSFRAIATLRLFASIAYELISYLLVVVLFHSLSFQHSVVGTNADIFDAVGCTFQLMHFHHRIFFTSSASPHTITFFCISLHGIIFLFDVVVRRSATRHHLHRNIIFYFLRFFDSNEFHCSHKHETVEQLSAPPPLSDTAVTDEAFVAFDRTHEEVPAPTVHLISK